MDLTNCIARFNDLPDLENDYKTWKSDAVKKIDLINKQMRLKNGLE